MKALKYGFGLALIAGFTLMAACGGSSSDSGGSGAGASSAGAGTTAGDGSTTAGSGSTVGGDTSVAGGDTAGSGTTTGGNSASAGGPAMGGAGKGGGSAGAGTGGTGGTGGASAMNPKDCPAALPTGACMPLASNQERCVYGDQSCRCRAPQQGGGNAGAGGAATGDMWQCTTVVACPTAKPTVGNDCPQAGEVCTYMGNGGCVCNNNTKKWQCFGGTTGNGGAGGMSGTAGAGGGTAATPCPQMKPAADATCTGSNLCQYGKGSGCICDGMNWICN